MGFIAIKRIMAMKVQGVFRQILNSKTENPIEMPVNYIWNVMADQSDSIIFHVISAKLGDKDSEAFEKGLSKGWIRLSAEKFIREGVPDNGQTVVLMKPHLPA